MRISDWSSDVCSSGLAVPLSQCQLSLSAKYSKPSYNINLQYEFGPSQQVYIAHRHGYRTGGLNTRPSTEAGFRSNFVPALVDDYELGLKADWYLDEFLLRTHLEFYGPSNWQDRRVGK